MSGNEPGLDPANPKRRPLIALAVVIFLLLAGLAGVSIWLIGNYINQPQSAAVETVTAAVPLSPALVAAQPLAGPGLHGRILSADGTPVSGATVFIVPPGPSNLRIRNGKIFFANDGRGSVRRVSTDANGQYELPAQSGNYELDAMSDAGFAQLDQDAAAKNGDVKLTKWGRVQGRLMIGSKPGAKIRLQAWSVVERDGQPLVWNLMTNFAFTDAGGNFTMNCVVPGTIKIARDFPQKSGGATMVFTANVGTTEVAAGETATVNLGGVGRPVVGKFVFPSTLNPSDYFINARAIQTGRNAVPGQYFLQVDAEHNFRIDNVPSGDYRIHVFLQKVRGDRTEQPEQTYFSMPDIPGGVWDEPLAIPDIELQ